MLKVIWIYYIYISYLYIRKFFIKISCISCRWRCWSLYIYIHNNNNTFCLNGPISLSLSTSLLLFKLSLTRTDNELEWIGPGAIDLLRDMDVGGIGIDGGLIYLGLSDRDLPLNSYYIHIYITYIIYTSLNGSKSAVESDNKGGIYKCYSNYYKIL